MAGRRSEFDPRRMLAALEANYVDYVLIGGLARVLRGTDEITDGADICPSFAGANLERLARAVSDLGGAPEAIAQEKRLTEEPLITVPTSAGPLNVVATPAGAPNGFVDLRRGATREDLGHGVRPLVASTADLARLAAALGRDHDLERLRDLRRIMELEVNRAATQAPRAASPMTAQRRPTRRINR